MEHILSLATSQTDDFWTVIGILLLIAAVGVGLFFFGLFRGETKKGGALIMLVGLLLMAVGVAGTRIYGR